MKNLSSLTGNRLHEIYGAQPQVSQADAALQAGAVVYLKCLWCSAAALVERSGGNHVFLQPARFLSVFLYLCAWVIRTVKCD